MLYIKNNNDPSFKGSHESLKLEKLLRLRHFGSKNISFRLVVISFSYYFYFPFKSDFSLPQPRCFFCTLIYVNQTFWQLNISFNLSGNIPYCWILFSVLQDKSLSAVMFQIIMQTCVLQQKLKTEYYLLSAKQIIIQRIKAV